MVQGLRYIRSQKSSVNATQAVSLSCRVLGVVGNILNLPCWLDGEQMNSAACQLARTVTARTLSCWDS